MISRRRATVATVVGSAANTVVVSLQAVLLIPLYIRILGPELYGAWVGSGDVLVWLQAFDLGLPNLMIQRIGAAHAKSDERTVAAYAATGLAAMAVVACAVVALGCVAGNFLPRWFHLDAANGSQLRSAFQLGVIGCGIIVFNNSIVGFARAIQKTAVINACMVLAAIVGFVVSLVALLRGARLWAIPLGIVARALVALLASIVFMWREIAPEMRADFRIRREMLREILHVSPATAIAGMSYALMNQSEAAIIGFTIGPTAILVFTLTKKAADVARSLLDVISYSSYGGFAHLVASDQRHRTLDVMNEISAIRWSAATTAAVVLMTVNQSLVSRWVGSQMYAGWGVTVAVAIQLIVVGNSYLLNSLYRACGPVLKGSLALVVECAVRVPLMFIFLRAFGLVGLPIASALTSATAFAIVKRWTLKLLTAFTTATASIRTPSRVVVARLALFCAGAAAARVVCRPSWPFIVLTSAIVGLACALTFLSVDPALANVRRLLRRTTTSAH